jgi:hypothetical protein
MTATGRRIVADEAAAVAAAWSASGAPASWALTAAQFAALRDDVELQAIAATIPPDRLPPLLFTAAVNSLVLEFEPQPLRAWFPRMGAPQPALGADFASHYRAFCLDQRERLLARCAHHRYQMNEVGRCADLLPALMADEQRPVVLVDIGTGAGLGLHLDRYRYVFRRSGHGGSEVGDPASAVMLETEVRGLHPVPAVGALPPIADRVGIDIEPLDIADPAVLSWLAACLPQEVGAVTRFHRAVDVALAHPARTVRGDATSVLPEVVGSIPEDQLVWIVDSYVHVFFAPAQLERFRDLIEEMGSRRDLDWVSLDPLVPMGATATGSVTGVTVPPWLLERNRREGVFGVLTRLSYRGGERRQELLAIAHPGAAWLEWLAPPDLQPCSRPRGGPGEAVP